MPVGQVHTVARVEDVPQGSGRVVQAGEQEVALFHCDDGFYATQAKCLHMGGPVGRGKLEGCVVACPWHGWQYDVRDGRCDTFSSKSVATYPVRVDEEGVFVTLP